MAQDFHAAFGLGVDERMIDAVDIEGVALAAVQGLRELLLEKTEEVTHLRREASLLRDRLERLEAVVATLESGDPARVGR